MKKEVKATRDILNKEGKLSFSNGSELDVNFDLIELEDHVDGLAGRRYSYGRLRFKERLEPHIASQLLSTSRLILTGDGISAKLCLYNLHSFTVFGALMDNSARNERVAA
jgi:hypothetical protein